ncbi:unnamed protein product, partial [marine sediment metagenome]
NVSTPQVADSGFPGTVTAKDQYNNTVTTDSSTVITMTNTGSALFYTSSSYATTTDNYTLASGETAIYMKDTVSETITFSAVDANTKVGTSQSVTIQPEGTDHYVLTDVASITAGGEALYTVTREDKNENLVTAGDEDVTLTSNSTGTYEFRASSGGPSTTYVTITDGNSSENFYYYEESAGSWTITVSRGGVTPDTDLLVVNPDVVDSYTIIADTPQTAGTGFSGTLEGYDQYSNLVTNDSSTVVTMSNTGSADFYTDGGYGTTTDNYTLSSGVAVIYVQDDVAETITLSAVDANTKVGTSANIVIDPAGIDYYTVLADTPQTAGVGFQGTVEAYDVYDNLATNDSSTVITMTNTGAAAFYTDGGYGTATDNYTLSSGIAVIYVRDNTAETITISAVDANTKVGTTDNIVIEPAAIDHYVVDADTPQTAGTGFSGTVTAEDQYNNTVTTDSSTVITMTNTGSADFYTDGGYGTTTDNYTLSSGVAVIYVQDD